MANTKISALTALTNPTWNEELVYAYNNANGKMTLDTMKTFASADSQATLVSGVNIKTINGDSILWSWNLVVSWWGGGGWFEPTELGWDANIWELSEWVYETTYDLYYVSWQKVPAAWSLSTKKQMLFVTGTTEKWFFVFNVSSSNAWYASYGYSTSSSVWNCYQLWIRDWALKHYGNVVDSWLSHPDALNNETLTQVLENIDDSGNNVLEVSTQNPPYPWVTYTVLVNSVASWETYSISLWTWVTNPFNITLPTNSNKKCLITLLITSSTTAIVTGCTIAS